MNRNLTIRWFQRNQNYQISPCILGVIVLKSQRLNSGWFWIAIGQMTNWRVKPWWKLMNQISTENWLKNESNKTKFEKIGLEIREKSLFGNRQKSTMKFGWNEEILNS